MNRLRSVLDVSTLIVGIAVAVVTVSLWAYANRPEKEPPWPKRVQGFSFSPMQMHNDPLERDFPTEQEVESDLALLAGKAHAVRTYAMEDVWAKIPAMAKKHGLNVTMGAWIDTREEHNAQEIAELIRVANESPNVVRVMVGNEAILRGDVTVEEMSRMLDDVRAKVQQPVSTAEPWHVWIKHPELAEHVDFLAVHMLPYWEGVSVDDAVEYTVRRMDQLKKKFPDKPIVITEVGWPSNGRTRMAAVASPSNEATFLRRFLERAEKEKYVYYIMEAFDQPWKRRTEGAVGAYWGVYDVYRQPKFAFTESIVAIPNWYVLAGISVVIAAIAFILLLSDSRTLRTRGRGFLASIAFAAATVVVWIVYDYTNQYLTIGSVLIGILMLTGMVGVSIVILTEAHEWAEATWLAEHRRKFVLIAQPDGPWPMVSIHVPTHNEPPEMVIETLNALAELDYPSFEVIVVDNNTADEHTWKPVETHCALLGKRFHFFHVDQMAGFKAGALNFALRHTHADAQIVGVIDSDYVVAKNWLRDLVPQFTNEKTAIVQAPQDYRDADESVFKGMCYAEYRGFFFIGMITRNERNAIIQHGTMTLVRKSTLQEVGNWSEWCITEDAELGLRMFEHGYEAMYIPQSYGQGLMPDSFEAYKKQRFRWAYGAMQIVRHHWSVLIGRSKSALTYGQRYHFLAGWLPWIADAANLMFNLSALFWSCAMVMLPRRVDAPMVEFAMLPLALFAFKLGKLVYLYRTRMHASVLQILGAAVAGISLSHTIALASFKGLATDDQPFLRTPKRVRNNPIAVALSSVREETLFMIALLLAAWVISDRPSATTLDMHVWVVVLLIQAVPYAAALLVSLISALPAAKKKQPLLQGL